MNETKKRGNANLPALILLAVLLMFWQAAAMGIDAAYILPSPTQILVRLWELRGPLFTAHLPATMSVVAIGLSISIVLGLALIAFDREHKILDLLNLSCHRFRFFLCFLRFRLN